MSRVLRRNPDMFSYVLHSAVKEKSCAHMVILIKNWSVTLLSQYERDLFDAHDIPCEGRTTLSLLA